MSSDPYLTGTVLSVQPLADLFGVGLVAAHDPDAVLASSVVPGSPIAGPRLDGLEPTCVLRDAMTRHWLKPALFSWTPRSRKSGGRRSAIRRLPTGMLIANSIIPRASRWNTPGGYHARPVSGSRESSRAREPDRTKGEGEPSPEGSVNHHRLSRVESASEAAPCRRAASRCPGVGGTQ